MSIRHPAVRPTLMSDPDLNTSNAVMQAMLKMNEIVIADLQKAHAAA